MGYVIVGSVVGSAITFGPAKEFSTAAMSGQADQNTLGLTSNPITGTISISWTNNSQQIYITTGYVSGDSFTILGTTTANTGSYSSLNSTFDTVNKKVVVVGRFSSGKGFAYNPVATSLTSTNYIGVSDGSFSNGQAASIKTIGAEVTQSGLVAGSIYYVQNNGSLSTSKSTPLVYAGMALSTTKLLIKG